MEIKNKVFDKITDGVGLGLAYAGNIVLTLITIWEMYGMSGLNEFVMGLINWGLPF